MNKKLTLFLILLIAGFLRLYRLDQVPPSPSLDEVSIGYNAYSILKTGADEYGTKWPILLRAYDDWRPALYVYLVIPFVQVLGLSVWAVRLPAFFLSMVTVVASYFLAKEVFKGTEREKEHSLATTFFLGISPWHIYLSRLGHEVNAGLTFIILGILFFIKFRWLWSSLFMTASLYAYQSQKVFTPLILLVLFLVYRVKLFQEKKGVLAAIILASLLLIPLVRVSLTPEAMMRFRGTSVFGQQNELYELAAQRREGLGLVFDNRRWVDIGVVLRNYLTHFDPVWLFLNSGRENHKVPSLGLFYLWELPLMLVGIYALIRLPISRRVKYLFLGWILIAPVPASITTQAPHAMRSFNVLPVPMILSAIGLVTLINHWRKRGLWFLVFGVSLLFFYQQYFVNFPREQSDSFQYPLAGAVRYALAEENKYQKIVFTNQGQGYQSYMSYLLFSQYDPKVYQQQGGTVMGGYNEVHEIGKYEFRPINWLKEAKDGTVLYIGEVDDFPNETKRQENFYFLNRQPGLVAVK